MRHPPVAHLYDIDQDTLSDAILYHMERVRTEVLPSLYSRRYGELAQHFSQDSKIASTQDQLEDVWRLSIAICCLQGALTFAEQALREREINQLVAARYTLESI